MNAQLLALFTSAQIALTDLVERTRDEEEGQTFVEWLAVMAIILALVAAFSGKLGGVAEAVTGKAGELIKGVAKPS
jgi:hypothetical protein